jgi:hypothetical protein
METLATNAVAEIDLEEMNGHVIPADDETQV